MIHTQKDIWYGTTVLLVRQKQDVVMVADGQVSLGNTIVKHSASKVRALLDGKALVGFAGATADAFTLFERLEKKLEQYPQQLSRACVELAQEWRTDRYLRRLEAMLAVANHKHGFILTGSGDVLEPEDGLIGIGSGGTYAQAAARALVGRGLSSEEVAKTAMKIAADICVYTNTHLVMEKISS
ncbi:ATP-dependent protease subunit HslV [Candidatus Hepatobacter penaei]|uniref:ATP-dependent protease subunit HslV n=1 Tax=Candidatus Hepatobacter penaei TaxID=1274402 RepID=UPI0004F30FE6|nr:ATP-dependent protease subunit HslV [Candidatus Hepatobacter penaei]